jgi:hypothetical protein
MTERTRDLESSRAAALNIMEDSEQARRKAEEANKALKVSEVLKALQHFVYKRHQIMVFHLMDGAELDFPFKKILSFVDMETNERLQVDPRYVREGYVQEIKGFIDSRDHDNRGFWVKG